MVDVMEEIFYDRSGEALEQVSQVWLLHHQKYSRFDGILSKQIEGVPAYEGGMD